MATTATMPTSTDRPPGWGTRFGVYYRPDPRSPWACLTHAGTRDGAVLLMHRLTSTSPSGDWIVRPTTDPPEDRRPRRPNHPKETTTDE